MASRDRVRTLDQASFDRFRAELARSGFHSSDGGRTWTGPIAAPLRTLTDSNTMTICISDGWPYVQPQLTVPGLRPLEHVNAGGVVCLWPHGDAAREWMKLAGWQARIEEWAAGAVDGFSATDAVMDAHRYFEGGADGLAEMDLSTLAIGTQDAASGSLYGRRVRGNDLLLSAERSGGAEVKGTWFFRRSVAVPPRDLHAFAALLTPGQQAELEQLTAKARIGRRRVAMLVWDTAAGARNALVVEVFGKPTAGSVGRRKRGHKSRQRGHRSQQREWSLHARALEIAPIDTAALQSRAGHQAARLAHYSVVIFGVGAVGSHVAVLLAESGVGTITVVDGDRLRPGNVVRHVAGAAEVGHHKTTATAAVIRQHAPWTTIHCVDESSWAPDRIRDLVDQHDLAVDATGIVGFSDQLARVTAEADETLVTAALYRAGSVARVCRQGPTDTPLSARIDPSHYPAIPRDPAGEPLQLEAGCSAPVNLAPPHSVALCAALAVDVIVDALGGVPERPDELTEVLQPLETAPFDRIGRLDSA